MIVSLRTVDITTITTVIMHKVTVLVQSHRLKLDIRKDPLFNSPGWQTVCLCGSVMHQTEAACPLDCSCVSVVCSSMGRPMPASASTAVSHLITVIQGWVRLPRLHYSILTQTCCLATMPRPGVRTTCTRRRALAPSGMNSLTFLTPHQMVQCCVQVSWDVQSNHTLCNDSCSITARAIESSTRSTH